MEWGINLKGHAFDLADWRDTLQQPFDPHVEVIDRDGTKMFILFANELQDCEDASEVQDAAIPLLRRLNALAAIDRNSDAVEEDGIVQRDAMGNIRRHYKLAAGTARMRTRVSAVGVVVRSTNGEVVEQPPQPSFAQTALSGASTHLSEALEDFSRADNWHDLYKVVEAICHECGGEHHVGARCGVSQQDVKDIKATAQFTRHHRTSARPNRKWELAEAKVFVGTLLKRLLQPDE